MKGTFVADNDFMPLSETIRLMADVIRKGKGKVQVNFEPLFLYEVANILEDYEAQELW
jgi:hypothetical protein